MFVSVEVEFSLIRRNANINISLKLILNILKALYLITLTKSHLCMNVHVNYFKLDIFSSQDTPNLVHTCASVILNSLKDLQDLKDFQDWTLM